MRIAYFFIALFLFASMEKIDAHTTLIFQPDSACGKDALVASLWPNNNYGTHPDFIATAWTNQGNPNTLRALESFDLATIPPNVTVISATLELYHYPSTFNIGHSNMSGPASCWLERITQPWSENSVTWNSQPATSIQNQLNIPAPTTTTQNYMLNVTALVIDMMNDPTNSFGFMLRLQNETYYRSLLFASSDMSTSGLRPKLVVTYSTETLPAAGCWTSVVVSPGGSPTSQDPKITIPNVFTPNNDGINDVFFADTTGIIVREFEIYNRWGNLIFHSAPGSPWDGKSENNLPCTDGVYYFILTYEINSGARKDIAGFVTLIR